ncbi:hypothetical protein [Sphingobium sp. IP1]|uniref:hypothetical protein n=1 Tax=Sphingobium sp. IP1 TaxID=2021637 RepID=UPI00117AA3C0|nr:hypothetical protein [Sphingobium sp. IP1]
MFFFDLELNRWKTDAIVGISRPFSSTGDGNKNLRTVELKNGKTVTIHEANLRDIEQAISHMIPARPGILAITHEDEEGIETKPVIAWGITLDGSILPITRDGINDGMTGTLPIIDPDADKNASGFYQSVDAYHAAQANAESQIP